MLKPFFNELTYTSNERAENLAFGCVYHVLRKMPNNVVLRLKSVSTHAVHPVPSQFPCISCFDIFILQSIVG